MSGEDLPSLVSSTMNDWLSPAVLFLFLNLMIASIAISSKLSSSSSDHETIEQNHRHRQQGEEEQNPSSASCFEPPKEPLPVLGSPSVLGRIEPSDFRISMADQREPELEQETEEINDESYREIYGNIKVNSAGKIGQQQEAAPSMRSSWNLKSDSGKYQRCEGNGGGGGGVEEDAVVEEDEGVDARADDFINRFKQQLKLQRLESLSRYRAMLGLS